MPIFPSFSNATFDPNLTTLMGQAFELAVGFLMYVPPQIIQEVMANRIIEAAHKGERNVERLRDAALIGVVR